MISVDGVEYSPYLLVPDYYQSAGAIGADSRSLFGMVTALRIGAGKTFTLTAKREAGKIYGYFTRAQVELLAAIRDAGRAVVFDYHGRVHTVVIPLTGLDVTLVQNRTDPGESEKYTGTVTLVSQ